MQSIKTQAVKTETFSDSTLDYDSMFEYPARVKRCIYYIRYVLLSKKTLTAQNAPFFCNPP